MAVCLRADWLPEGLPENGYFANTACQSPSAFDRHSRERSIEVVDLTAVGYGVHLCGFVAQGVAREAYTLPDENIAPVPGQPVAAR